MIRLSIYILAGLIAAVCLVSYGADRLSQPSDFSVFIGSAEIVLAIGVLALVARYTYIQLKLNKN